MELLTKHREMLQQSSLLCDKPSDDILQQRFQILDLARQAAQLKQPHEGDVETISVLAEMLPWLAEKPSVHQAEASTNGDASATANEVKKLRRKLFRLQAERQVQMFSTIPLTDLRKGTNIMKNNIVEVLKEKRNEALETFGEGEVKTAIWFETISCASFCRYNFF